MGVGYRPQHETVLSIVLCLFLACTHLKKIKMNVFVYRQEACPPGVCEDPEVTAEVLRSGLITDGSELCVRRRQVRHGL